MEDTWEGRHALLSYTALVATQAQPLVSLATHLYVDTLWSEDDNRLAALLPWKQAACMHVHYNVHKVSEIIIQIASRHNWYTLHERSIGITY